MEAPRILVALLMLCAAAQDGTQESPFQRLQSAERRGDLAAALAAADALDELGSPDEPVPLDEATARRVDRLRSGAQALQDARILREKGWLSDARRQLGILESSLDEDDHLALRIALREASAALSRAQLAAARTDVQHERWASARTRLDELLQLDLSDIESADRATAATVLDSLAALEAPPDPPPESPPADEEEPAPGLLDELGEEFAGHGRVVLRWTIYTALAVLVVALGRRLRRLRPRTGTLLALEDLSADPSQRQDASRRLNAELADAVGRIVTSGSSSKGLSLVSESTRAVLGLGTDDPLASLDPLVQEADTQFGPFKFNLRQVLAWIRLLVRRPFSQTLHGGLHEEGGVTVILVEVRDPRGAVVPASSLSLRAEGEGSRRRAMASLAARVTMILSERVVTRDRRSLEHLVRAEALLGRERDGETGRELLELARHELNHALRHDQANWMARFQLAGILRQQGEFHSSATHYEYLRTRVLGSRAMKEPGILLPPEGFGWMVRYNEAVSRVRIGSHRELSKAVAATEELFALLRDHPDAEGRERREVLARSLRAECWSKRLGQELRRWGDPEGDSEGDPAPFLPLLERIEKDEEWLWRRVSDLGRGDLTEYSYAHFLARSALGRAYFLLSRYRQARRFLQWALDLYGAAPNLDVKRQLAFLHLRHREDSQWAERARALLQEVVEARPDDPLAQRMLGELYLEPEFYDPEKAEAALGAAPTDPQCSFLLGHLQVVVLDKVPEGMAAVRRSSLGLTALGRRHREILASFQAAVEGGLVPAEVDRVFAARLAQLLAELPDPATKRKAKRARKARKSPKAPAEEG